MMTPSVSFKLVQKSVSVANTNLMNIVLHKRVITFYQILIILQ